MTLAYSFVVASNPVPISIPCYKVCLEVYLTNTQCPLSKYVKGVSLTVSLSWCVDIAVIGACISVSKEVVSLEY